MRKEFGRVIVKLAESDRDIYLLAGDLGFGVFDEFRERFPDRFFNIGIREQAMVSVASGMALEGLKPYLYTITPFLIERPFEQVKIMDQQNVNVKLIGYADYPSQGPTHAELDGKKLMSLLRNTQSYFPKNAAETREALTESYQNGKPTFISLKKDK